MLSDKQTVKWRPAGAIAVDGGSATFSSPEGAAVLRRSFDRDQDEWMRAQDRILDSQLAHDGLATNFAIDPRTNLVEFASGVGDGRYPVYVGYDAHGQPTRVVLDFSLLHLAWRR